jgi:AcrR family transcriptional regulator
MTLGGHQGGKAEMTEKTDRREAVLAAALRLLEQGGVPAVTTAALAREARCSKETLYGLFKDRDDILAALVSRQSARLNELLEGMGGEAQPLEALVDAGARLLDLLTSEASLAINRAALADPSGALSRVLVEAGRNRTAPLLMRLLEAARRSGHFDFPDAAEAYRAFYGLLIADRQIAALHRVEGSRPDPETRLALARRAVRDLALLFPGSPAPDATPRRSRTP